MARNNQLNALLMEFFVAVLFFVLSATVILQTFVGAHELSMQADAYNEAMTIAQSVADELYFAEDGETVLLREGFANENGTFTLERDGIAVSVVLSETEEAAGIMRCAAIRAVYGEKELISMDSLRYVPSEVNP